MAYDLEKSLKELETFANIAELEMSNIASSIEEKGFFPIDESLPIFVKTGDFMNSEVDPLNVDVENEEKKLRDSILGTRQIISELEREGQRRL